MNEVYFVWFSVVDVSRKVKTKQRPQGLNTVELLRVSSSTLGIGPHDTMHIAERLYTSGYINYPRTESTAYPPSFDLKALLRQHVSLPVLFSFCSILFFLGGGGVAQTRLTC